MRSLFIQSFVALSIFILKLKTNMLFGSVSKTLSKIPLASVRFPALYNVNALTVKAAGIVRIYC